jgi:hypothetical protein
MAAKSGTKGTKVVSSKGERNMKAASSKVQSKSNASKKGVKNMTQFERYTERWAKFVKATKGVVKVKKHTHFADGSELIFVKMADGSFEVRHYTEGTAKKAYNIVIDGAKVAEADKVYKEFRDTANYKGWYVYA